MTSPVTAVATPYDSSLQHILDELGRIDLLIRFRVWQARESQDGPGDLRGLYISPEEIDQLLARPVSLPLWAIESDHPRTPEFQDLLGQCAAEISARKEMSREQGVSLRLDDLARLFKLSSLEIDVLLISLAPEIDLRYERLYAFLQDDVTRKRPSVDLVMNLLLSSVEDKIETRQLFESTAPLVKNHLIHLVEDPANPHPPVLAKYLKVDERIAGYLLGSDSLASRILPYANLVTPNQLPGEPFEQDAIVAQLEGFKAEARNSDASHIIYLQGPYGVGKRATALSLCSKIGAPLLVVDARSLARLEDPTFTDAMRLAKREALLQNAVLLCENWDDLLSQGKGDHARVFIRELDGWRGPVFLAGNRAWEPDRELRHLSFIRIKLPPPTDHERVQLWSHALDGRAVDFQDQELEQLATKFRFTGEQIRDAASTARNLATWRDPDGGQVTLDDLYRASRLHSNRGLASLAQKITPHYSWDDIVLPEDQMQQLWEICGFVRHRSQVLERWGFERKLSMGKGLIVLFSGGSGTGKTMAADIIASELELDLYKIDLSTVVSKYIGETEKNLSRIFDEAETSNAILFFDEADALFGKRSEVRDSHDRYANIEISYLLQRVEAYDGIVILATNLRRNMDDAFVRRMHFIVEFPFPSEEDRRRIWEGIWPDDTPRASDLDLDLMAQRYQVSGGNIRNIALAAAFLAAENGSEVNMIHLYHATQREYQKMGKVMSNGSIEKASRSGTGA